MLLLGLSREHGKHFPEIVGAGFEVGFAGVVQPRLIDRNGPDFVILCVEMELIAEGLGGWRPRETRSGGEDYLAVNRRTDASRGWLER